MSPFVHHLRFSAIGLLGAAALASPARADVVASPVAEPCPHASSQMATACRPIRRSARRASSRTLQADPGRPFPADLAELPAGRYVSLLILGVGF